MATKAYRAAREAREPGYLQRLSDEQRAYYQRTTPRRAVVDRERFDERHRWMATLKDRPCEDCGNKYAPCVMDWHHRDPALKSFSVGRGLRRKQEVVLAEIQKCALLCANCHRLREYGR